MIRIDITDFDFEHDLFSLVRSFYPGVQTTVEKIPRLPEYPPYAIIHLGEEETGGEEDFLSVFFPDVPDYFPEGKESEEAFSAMSGEERLALKS